MEHYFKSEKVVCNFEGGCTNKSKVFCGNCTRNFNIRHRDWFKPTENHKKLIEMIKRD